MSDQTALGDIPGDKINEGFSEEQNTYFRFPIPSDWEVRTISEIGKVKGGSTPKTSKEEYWGGEIPWLTPTEVTESKKIEIYETERNLHSTPKCNSQTFRSSIVCFVRCSIIE